MACAEEPKRVRHITEGDILDLINKRDHELVETLNRAGYGFGKFIESKAYLMKDNKIKFEVVETIVEVSSRMCTIRCDNNLGRVKRFLEMVGSCDKFLFSDVLEVMNICLEEKRKFDLASFTRHYIIVLRTIVKLQLEPAQKVIDFGFPGLQNIINTMKALKIRNMQYVIIEYNTLKFAVEKFEEPATIDEDDDEAELYRKLPIVPRDNDVINVIVPDLPYNKIDGPYKSVSQYLSVHFRLLREDMLRAFRDVIRMCENPSEAHKSGCHLYDEVKVKYPPKYTPDGICYDISVWSSNWMDLSKKDVLMPGNMVCLTPNQFRSVIFAVNTKSPRAGKNRVKQCTSEIKLEDTFEDILETNKDYFMVETNAYFECYKHILSAIQAFNKNSLPFSDFLAFLDFEKSEPVYLAYPKKKIYCLHEKCDGSGKKPDSEADVQNKDDYLAVNKAKLLKSDTNEKDNEDACECKRFDPLCYEDWPSAQDLKLDDQQLEAFKTALTKKVAVIQGPPGTGKTFIGVKVVKALLENIPLTPIIICCLTNHALDQFLEHILNHTKHVIRLGSQSKSTILQPYTIDNLLYCCKKYKDDPNSSLFHENDILNKSLKILKSMVPSVLHKNKLGEYDAKFLKLKDLCQVIDNCFGSLSLCEEKYLDESALNEIIGTEEKKQLRQGSSTHSKNLSASLLEWLCCTRSKLLYEECENRFKKIKLKKNLDSLNSGGNWNLWALDLQKRYELFYCWREKALEILRRNLTEEKEKYKRLKEEFCGRLPDSTKIEILQRAHVIGVTTTGAAKFRELLLYTYPSILIVEEAAEVLEAHIISSLLPSNEHLILIGDHKQLRPLPANHELSEAYNLKISMFERLFNNEAPQATLVSQHRMKPCISDLLVQKELYEELRDYENVLKYEDIRGVKSSLYFLNHSEPEDQMSSGTSSLNKFEARMIASLAKYFCLQSYTEAQITILATYAAQVPCIQEYLMELKLEEVFVTTVDNYQGEENDIVLVSFVRSNRAGLIGFLKESNRVCVALSRAKKGMFCIGNFTMYSGRNSLWKGIVEKLEAQNMIGPKIPLQCSQHQKEIFVANPEEIMGYTETGCSEKCGFELACGHTCVRRCHYDDPDHVRYQCTMPCEKYVDEDKKCSRMCYRRCKKIKKVNIDLGCGHRARQKKDGSIYEVCEEEVQTVLPCKHVDTVTCGTNVFRHRCKALVPVLLSCGHKKTVFCYRSNDLDHVICSELKPVLGPCGHTIDVPCYMKFYGDDFLTYCDKSCDALLTCGHSCTGRCRWCLDIGIHTLCTEKCKVKLNCGHGCGGFCGSPCPPCEKICTMICSHNTHCVNPCSRPCVECNKKCERGCAHVGMCANKCFEVCSVKACSSVCMEILDCGHTCIGLCSDPCPNLCRVCNREELNSSNPESDHFIQLEDCDHVIEISELTEHIDSCIECFMWPDCPVCHRSIFKSSRYKDRLRELKKSVLKSANNPQEVDEVHYLLNSLFGADCIVPAEFLDIYKKINDILHKNKPTSGALYVLKACITSLRNLILINERLKKFENSSDLQMRFETLLLWVCNHLQHASYQQLDELAMAVDQLKSCLST